MKKFLSILSAVGLTSTAAIAVVACGKTDKITVVETGDLNSIIKLKDRTVPGNAKMITPQDALRAFLNTRAGRQLNRGNVQVNEDTFVAAQPGVNGSFDIEAKTGTLNYSGKLHIVIKGYELKKLESVVKEENRQVNDNIAVDAKMQTASGVLAAFLAIPANSFLTNEVEVKDGEGSFVPAKPNENQTGIIDGRLVVQAKTGSEYVGELTITIKWKKVSFASIKDNLVTEIEGKDGLKADEALEDFLKIPGNEFLGDWKADLIVDSFSFVPSTADKDGKFVVAPAAWNTESGADNFSLTGELTITIKRYTRELHPSDWTTTISGTKNMSEDDALESFLSIPKNSVLRGEVQVKRGSFAAPQPLINGSFTIVPKSNSDKYTGELHIVIGGYELKELESAVKKENRQVNDNIAVDAKMQTASGVLAAFLAIPANSFLTNAVEVKDGEGSFVAAQPNEDETGMIDGRLVIQAKTGSEYAGELTITIKWQKVSFASIKDNLVTEIEGKDGLIEDEALEDFLKIPGNEFLRDWKADLLVKEGSFVPSTADKDGKFVVVPGRDEEFDVDNFSLTGELTITIKSFGQSA